MFDIMEIIKSKLLVIYSKNYKFINYTILEIYIFQKW